MNKTWLIIKREYLTRVRNKTFILSTFLTPLLFAGLITVIIFITVKSNDREKVAIIDNSGIFKSPTDSIKSIKFVLNPNNIDTSNFEKEKFTGILYSPHSGINGTDKWQLWSKKTFGVMAREQIDEKIGKEIENDILLTRFKSSSKTVDSIRKISHDSRAVPKLVGHNPEAKEGDSVTASAIGYGAGFLIYITLFIYGSMVLRGVMEEKTNRIAEVIVSSVKPFQLMMGKIIGVGAVGLTQFIMWIVLIAVFSSIAGAFIPKELLEQASQANNQIPGGPMNQQSSQAVVAFTGALRELSRVNWWFVVSCFVFYFLFGYLFYASLFAAVGSAINEDPQDAQSLMFPITMPIILAIVIMINAITHPQSPLATWSSMIPFFSPIVMMARIPFGVPGTVPYWQLGVSMLLLVLGFLATTWLSAKIYRTGILLYGKKVTLKEMWKWAVRSN
jgi:ABC-2 type transport system permease protein